MDKHQWITWLMFLQTEETLPQDETEDEIANGEIVNITNCEWELEDMN